MSRLIPVLLAFLSFSSFVSAVSDTTLAVATEEFPIALTPSSEHIEATIEIIDTLSGDHYRNLQLSDELSANMFDEYLDMLDPSRSFFTALDIAEFKKSRFLLDDYLKQGQIQFGFDLYSRHLTLALARYTSNIKLLESEATFDLHSSDALNLDRKELPWVSATQELDQYWVKRITDSLLRLQLSDKTSEEARDLLIKRYRNLVNRLKQRNADDVFELYMNALTKLYDPHTTYMSPHSLENFKIAMSLSLEGIGAVLQTSDEYTQVVRIIKGGPADQQGILQPEDKIISVAQGEETPVDVVGWRLDEVVEMIRGAKDTVVKLEILSATSSTSQVIAITRDKIKLEEQSAKSEIITVPSANPDKPYQIGVISIPAFYLDFEALYKRQKNYKSTTNDTLKLIEELEEQAVDGIILDLRNNGGGYLTEATGLTDLFIDPGPVVQIKNASQRISRGQRARRPARYTGPLMVLINRLSASASEITAAALQDYGRALIVGGTSFGKGTVQSRLPVSNGELKMTESKFYRVSGESTQHKGVTPDIQFPTFYDYDELGESSYDHALIWDSIHPAPHRRYGDFAKIIPRLTAAHAQRLKSNPDLLHLQNLTAYTLERRDIDTLSLNLETRKNENDNYEQELLAYENTRRQQKGLEIYDSKESWKDATKEKDDLPLPVRDPLLFEAGNVFADLLKTDDSLARIN